MVVYCLKFVLRGESPRDYADLLRSLKFPPSISISDIPDRLASHVNSTVPGFFSPNLGRLFPATKENLASAELGILEKQLPWIHNEGTPSQTWSCQIWEGSGQRLWLLSPTSHSSLGPILPKWPFSREEFFPKRALLRRVTLVPQLNGIVNTEAEEQLHSLIDRFNYSLNTMKPINHLFMMRLRIHMHNSGINSTFKSKIESTFSAQAGHAVETRLDNYGRLVLSHGNALSLQKQHDERPSRADVPAETERPLSPIIPVSASNTKRRDRSPASTSRGNSNKSSPSVLSAMPASSPMKQTPGLPANDSKKTKVKSVSCERNGQALWNKRKIFSFLISVFFLSSLPY